MCCNKTKVLTWLGIVFVLAVGLIHVIDAPDSFEEAAYKGWLFYANGTGALVAAYGVAREKCWGWVLGLMVSAGALLGYVASRTIGLPLIPAEPSAWLEPLGVASLIAEAGFIALCIIWLRSKLGCQTSC